LKNDAFFQNKKFSFKNHLTKIKKMNRKLLVSFVIAFVMALTSCGSKQTAASIAQKWCDLNGKAHKAEGAAKDAAKAAVDKFEKEMEEKYKDKKEFMEEIGKEVEKCEAASEGR
jgi:peptidoglycan hydrolase CwlO-like protein